MARGNGSTKAQTEPQTEPQTETDNVTIEEIGNTLVITVLDVHRTFGPSSSGKTQKVAGTGGFVRLSGGLMASLNVNRKA